MGFLSKSTTKDQTNVWKHTKELVFWGGAPPWQAMDGLIFGDFPSCLNGFPMLLNAFR